MKDSPIRSTLALLTPFCLLAIPIWQVTHANPTLVARDTSAQDNVSKQGLETVIHFRGAHPWESIQVTANHKTYTVSDDEITLPLFLKEGGAKLLFNVKWSEDTPETALLIEITPEHLTQKTHTIWGIGNAVEELKLQWESKEWEPLDL